MTVTAPIIRYHGGNETRVRITSKDSPRGYRHEMDLDDHAELLAALQAVQGMVVLSGYPHPLYDDALRGWERRTTKARISGGRGTTLRDEVLWLNPACCAALQGGGLFSTIRPALATVGAAYPQASTRESVHG